MRFEQAVVVEGREVGEVQEVEEPQKQNSRFVAVQELALELALAAAQVATQVAEREAANFDRSSWTSLWNPGRRRSEKIDGRPDYTHSSGGRRNENTPRVIREKTRN